MDYQEAINNCNTMISDLKANMGNSIKIRQIHMAEIRTLETAIFAMQELQEYKEYGTPNGYKSALEAYDKCYSEKEIIDTELYKYQQIGTLEEVREAVEKQNKKHPTYDGDGYAPDGTFVWDEWLCPKCGTRYEVDYDDYDYCPNCGQRINWSEEE